MGTVNLKITKSGSLIHGSGSIAPGRYAHAEGMSVTASGNYSHAGGNQSEASGNFSRTEGTMTQAIGVSSHAEGFHTTASNNYEHAEGKYNATASSQIFSIGVGLSPAARRNALSVLDAQSASVFIQGIGDYDGTNPETGSNDVATVFKEETYITEPEMDEIFDYTRDAAVLSRDTSHDNSIYLTFGD